MNESRARLVEGIRIMREPSTGEFVNFQGAYYSIKNACLYMKADVAIFVAGVGAKIARIAGEIEDGFITGTPQTLDHIRDVLFRAVEDRAKSAGKSLDDITKVIELDVTCAEDYDKALASVRCWAATLVRKAYVKAISDPVNLPGADCS